jgi:predicted TPR repeat methyltransferase
MAIPDALRYALQLVDDRRLDAADELYRRILAIDPRCPEAWHFRGTLAVQRGQYEEGEELIRRAIEIHPGYADAHNNLGNVLQVLERYEEAIGFYELAIMLAPKLADAHYNLGRAYDNTGREEQAATAYRQALLLGKFHADVYRRLGWALYGMGRIEEAADVFGKWLALEPASEVARHMVAACTGKDIPTRASDGCVQNIFDRFAPSFDKVLKDLEYMAPALVGRMLADVRGEPAGQLEVLDAGCGTGLCGLHLRGYARRLVGVDLSPEMLKNAQARGIYDDLIEGELTRYLAATDQAWDLIASSDTLVYFGDLTPVMAAAARALRPGGLLVFTVERSEEEEAPEGFRLNPHGRYSHSERYILAALEAAGLTPEQIARADLRIEKKLPVGGLVVSASR